MSLEKVCLDVVTKLKAMSEFENRVGLSIGGHEYDPSLYKAPHPAAWVLYMGGSNTEDDNVCDPISEKTFTILVLHDYAEDTQLLTEVFPLLSKVKELHGEYPLDQDTSTDLIGAGKWNWKSESFTEVSKERIVYASTYTIKSTK